MATSERTPTRYASASDLPMIVEMRQQLRGLKMLSILKPSVRPEIRELETQLDRMTSLVDRFYDTLGHAELAVHRRSQPASPDHDLWAASTR